MLLSTAYFPPIQYFSKLVDLSEVSIEACENYQKQTYRNRCRIGSASGVISLPVPVLKGKEKKQKIRDVKISYETNWQKIHYRSIMSAYKHSPYYEFFIEDLVFAWEKPEKFLFDLNMKILEVIIELSGMTQPKVLLSEDYLEISGNNEDWRELINPKKKLIDSQFKIIPYQQVFNNRFGFQTNLSILDALFQLGPETRTFLKECNSRT